MNFTFEQQSIPEVILIKPKVYGDDRGFFIETYKKSLFTEQGITEDFVQANHSKSQKGVLRGLHFQKDPMAQGKLVRVISGSVYDVAVDIRKGSKTYGQYVGVTLSAENKALFWVPPGFAHGFLALEDDTEFEYMVTNEYSPEHEGGIQYNDPALKIEWPMKDEDLILSERDKLWPLL